MLMRETVCTRAGERFVGLFRVVGKGNAASVLVRFEQTIMCARKGGLPEEEVARTLLGELVQEKLADRRKPSH